MTGLSGGLLPIKLTQVPGIQFDWTMNKLRYELDGTKIELHE